MNELKNKQNGKNHNESNDFVRKSYKFLIRSDNLDKVRELLESTCVKFIFEETIPTTQKISSVYYDNNDYCSYYNRLTKNPDSICIRFRTYNSNYNNIYAECKTHKGYVVSKSIKERVCIDKSNLESYLNSRISYSQDTPEIGRAHV